MNDQLLEDVHVELEEVADGEKEWGEPILTIAIPALSYGTVESVFILFAFPESGAVTGNFRASLKYKVKDVDPTTGEPESDDTYEDDYEVRTLYRLSVV